MMSQSPIAIIGAGLAGLVCAKDLRSRGCSDFVVLEAGAEVGGRVRSRVTSGGYTLDLGFQVLLDSYPAARRHLDFAALRPRYFDSGAILADGGRRWVVANPLRHPGNFSATAFSTAFSWADKMRLAKLASSVMATPDECLLAQTASAEDLSTAGFLVAAGFSSALVERFIRPFFGGVFLDDTLATSAALFCYYLKKFVTGRALVPAPGMQEIPRQLARGLPGMCLRLGSRVEGIEFAGDRAIALRLAGGERFACRAVVIATDEPSAHRLTGETAPARPALGTTVVYFASAEPLYRRRMLFLPAGRTGLVRHLVAMTNVAPEFAPAGRHLLSATVLDRRGLGDDALIRRVRGEILGLFPGASTVARELDIVDLIDVPYALYHQGPGFARFSRPTPASSVWRNVWFAGDHTASCSINAAMASGEQVAESLLAGT